MKKNRGAVYVIAVALTVLSLIGFILMLVFLALHKIGWLTFILSILVSVVELIMVWALNNVLERIAVLESLLIEKKVIEESEIAEPVEEELPVETQPAEGVTFCKHCGFQLFPEDEVCPNCQSKVDKEDDGKQ